MYELTVKLLCIRTNLNILLSNAFCKRDMALSEPTLLSIATAPLQDRKKLKVEISKPLDRKAEVKEGAAEQDSKDTAGADLKDEDKEQPNAGSESANGVKQEDGTAPDQAQAVSEKRASDGAGTQCDDLNPSDGRETKEIRSGAHPGTESEKAGLGEPEALEGQVTASKKDTGDAADDEAEVSTESDEDRPGRDCHQAESAVQAEAPSTKTEATDVKPEERDGIGSVDPDRHQPVEMKVSYEVTWSMPPTCLIKAFSATPPVGSDFRQHKARSASMMK